MLYSINNKCYVNISPSIYVEVIISKDGTITPTNNKIEVNGSTEITQTTLDIELSKIKEVKEIKPIHNNYEMDKKYNKRKR